MARLIDWRVISKEKIARKRSWIKQRAATDPAFPMPKVQGRGSTLYDEGEIDDWLRAFVERDAPKGRQVRREVADKSRR